MKNTGFSLTELMVALVISSLIMITASIAYLSFKRTSGSILTSSQQLEDARLLSLFVSHEISLAGYAGCNTQQQHVLGFTIKHNHQNNAIDITYMQPLFGILVANSQAWQIAIVSEARLSPGQKIVVSSCEHTEITNVQSVRFSHGHYVVKVKPRLQYRYYTDAALGPLSHTEIYQGKHHQLFVRHNSKRADALLNNIDSVTFNITHHKVITQVIFEKHNPQGVGRTWTFASLPLRVLK